MTRPQENAARRMRAVNDSAHYLQQMEQFYPKKIDLVLTRMERLLRKLGEPQRFMPPAIHMAGTNGKGSVMALISAMLQANGDAPHGYSSPHLVRFHERICLNGRPISESALAKLLRHCLKENRAQPITFFEMTTAAAFCAFASRPARIVLLEVGLGGRLDATNCATNIALSLIGPIAHDHQEFLGTSLRAIADEKLGILRPRVPALIGRNRAAILAQAKAHARRIGAPLQVFGEDFGWQKRRKTWRYRDRKGALDLPYPALVGPHQLDNAALAVAAARALNCSDASIAQGLTHARWPGRLQKLHWSCQQNPREFWLDGGHNPHAAAALARWAKAQCADTGARLCLISAMMARKPARRFFAAFRALAPRAYALPLPQHNAYSAAALARAMRAAGLTAEPAADLADAFARIGKREAKESQKSLVLVCGSLYLAGRVLTDFPQAMS